MALPETNRWGVFRRWLGIYNQQEKEILDYARRVKQETIMVATGKKQVTRRPDWMRKADYDKLRTLSKKVEKKRQMRGIAGPLPERK